MISIFQLVVEHDNYYDTKEFDSFLFETEEDDFENRSLVLRFFANVGKFLPGDCKYSLNLLQ